MSLRPTQRTPNTLQFIISIGIAIVLHIPGLLLISLWEPQAAGDVRPYSTEAGAARSKQFSVKVLSEKKPAEKEKKPQEEDEERLQFVSAPLPEVEEVPDRAKYLDRVASKALKETVRKAAPGAPVIPVAKPMPKEPPAKEKAESGQTSTPQDDDKVAKGVQEKLADGGDSAREQATNAPMRPTVQPKNGGGAEATRLALPNFSNTPLISPNGDNGSIDYLRDVDEGDKTLLNRKESRYAAFFDRVKIQIADKWSPVSTYRKRDPRGNVYGVKDRYSQVRVTLNGDGTVRQLFLARESGLDFFDDEAVRSIRAAAPFHNPPEGLKDDDGLVHFTFGFYFEISAGPGMSVFR